MASSMISCPYCGKLTDPRLDNCVHCGGFLRKQAAPGRAKGRDSSETCPSCGAFVQEGDIICVACGTNLLTGQRITEKAAAPPRERFKLPSVNLKLVAGIAAGVLLAALLILLVVWFLSRDPIEQALNLKSQNKLIEAMDVLENVIERDPESARAHMELGKIRWEGGDFMSAADSFNRVIKIRRDDREAYMRAAVSYALAGGKDARDYQLKTLDAMVSQFPDDREAWSLLALARGQQGDLRGQVDALAEAALLSSGSSRAKRLLGIARALRDENAAAMSELEGALESSPDDGDVQATAGMIAAALGEPERGIAHLEAALNSQTTMEETTAVQLGLVLFSQGLYDEARNSFSRALAANADNEDARFFHAACLRKQGLSPESLAEFEPIAAGKGPYAGEAAVQAALLHLEADSAGRAVASIERALQTGADGAFLRTVQGRALVAENDVSGARDAFRKAIQADADYAPAHLEYGLLYVKRNAVKEGIQELEKYLALADHDSESSRVEDVRALISQLQQSSEHRASS